MTTWTIDIVYHTLLLLGCRNYRYYGEDCNMTCPTNCQERRCEINTGHCLGCIAGYHGQNCSQSMYLKIEIINHKNNINFFL